MTDEEERALLIGALLAGQIDVIAPDVLKQPYFSAYGPEGITRVGITRAQRKILLEDEFRFVEYPAGTTPFLSVHYICIAFDRMREVRTR